MLILQKWEDWACQCHLVFTISTEVCDLFYKNKKKLNKKIIKDINKELQIIEKEQKKIW